MRLEKAKHTVPTYVTRSFGLFARLLFVLLLVALSLTTRATVFARQAAQTGPLAGGAIRARGDEDDTIRPFRINVPEEALVDLRRRLEATRWPDQETVGDRSQHSGHFARHAERSNFYVKNEGGLDENDTNHCVSGANRRKRFGTVRSAGAAAGIEAHRSYDRAHGPEHARRRSP